MRLETSVHIWGKRGDHARGRTGAARTIHDHRTVTREFYEHLLPGQTAQERSFAEEAKYSSYYDRGQRSLPGPRQTTEEAQEPQYYECARCEFRWRLCLSGNGLCGGRNTASAHCARSA